MLTQQLQYELPQDLIAQYPVAPRDSSRLLVLTRGSHEITHTTFTKLADFLRAEDVLVVNDTKVIPARLFGYKEPEGKVEVLLLRKIPGVAELWECLVRKGRRLRKGTTMYFSSDLWGTVLSNGSSGRKMIAFETDGEFMEVVTEAGHMPLPPYIRRGRAEEIDKEGYQTIFARRAGAVAAPTAGLHFTRELVCEIESKGVRVTPVTLHVGAGSFLPIRAQRIEDHRLEPECYELSQSSANHINEAREKGGRVVAVGTTVVRVLETVADEDGKVRPQQGITDLYIYPGYRFKIIDALITNFHLPYSTLLLLVFALAGKRAIMKAYQEAVRAGYRFYSYGDGMLIV